MEANGIEEGGGKPEPLTYDELEDLMDRFPDG